jgi:hypothetical protein
MRSSTHIVAVISRGNVVNSTFYIMIKLKHEAHQFLLSEHTVDESIKVLIMILTFIIIIINKNANIILSNRILIQWLTHLLRCEYNWIFTNWKNQIIWGIPYYM